MRTPNALIQESVRAFYRGYYRDVVTDIPRIEKGEIHPLIGPGLGTDLLPDFTDREGVSVRVSAL